MVNQYQYPNPNPAELIPFEDFDPFLEPNGYNHDICIDVYDCLNRPASVMEPLYYEDDVYSDDESDSDFEPEPEVELEGDIVEPDIDTGLELVNEEMFLRSSEDENNNLPFQTRHEDGECRHWATLSEALDQIIHGDAWKVSFDKNDGTVDRVRLIKKVEPWASEQEYKLRQLSTVYEKMGDKFLFIVQEDTGCDEYLLKLNYSNVPENEKLEIIKRFALTEGFNLDPLFVTKLFEVHEAVSKHTWMSKFPETIDMIQQINRIKNVFASKEAILLEFRMA